MADRLTVARADGTEGVAAGAPRVSLGQEARPLSSLSAMTMIRDRRRLEVESGNDKI
jgi:hypothetical protein